jgi:mRNA interferase MazF
MEMKQFDVYLVNLDPTIGSEIKKTRPGIIVSPNVLNKYLQTVIVAPLTHRSKGYPSRISTEFKGEQGEIVLDQIRAVDKIRLVKKLGIINTQTGQEIKKVLQTMFS